MVTERGFASLRKHGGQNQEVHHSSLHCTVMCLGPVDYIEFSDGKYRMWKQNLCSDEARLMLFGACMY